MWRIFFLALLALEPVPVDSRAQGPHGPRNLLGQARGGPVDLAGRYGAYAERHGRGLAPGTPEFEERKALYARRAAFVAQHNSRPNRRWTAGINHLSDRTDAELAQLRGWRGLASASRGGIGKVASGHAEPAALLALRDVELPQEFNNWTKLTSLSDVRDQGGCGSCWAVAASVVLEAHAEIYASSKGTMLSTQELLDCTPNPHHCGGSGGCDGATVELAFNWALNHGVAQASDNPYTGSDGTCQKSGGRGTSSALQLGEGADEDLTAVGVHKPSKASGFLSSSRTGFGMRAWERLPENKQQPLIRALVERGPVGVSAAASTWFAYSSGIFDDCYKDATIDHAVTLIGIGVQQGQKYWLIQNSWGPGWGEQGRIKLLRQDSDDEHCGIDNQPEVGTGCDGGPKEVRVCGMCGVLYDSSVPHFKP